MFVRLRKAAGRKARAALDARHTEEWVGGDVWRDMVLEAMRSLRYIHEDNPGFFSKMVHNF